MFEDKKWSKGLKETAQRFWNRLHNDPLTSINQELLETLIEAAIEEGFENARETVRDWFEPEPPQRDESRD